MLEMELGFLSLLVFPLMVVCMFVFSKASQSKGCISCPPHLSSRDSSLINPSTDV